MVSPCSSWFFLVPSLEGAPSLASNQTEDAQRQRHLLAEDHTIPGFHQQKASCGLDGPPCHPVF